jgi:hypothetical protein
MQAAENIQHNDMAEGSFPGFKMRVICATFHCTGKNYSSWTAFSNLVRYFNPIIGNSFRILPVI